MLDRKAPRLAVLDLIKNDFRKFVYVVWKHLGLPDPTPVQYDIARYLQNGPKRLIIEAFRGVGKSWITSAFVDWALLCNPQSKILVVSASKPRADDFSIFTKRLIQEMPILAHLKASDDQRSSNISFDVGPARAAHAPSVKSVGITGQIVGSRADIIIADDIEVLTNTITQMMRDRLSETVKEFDSVLTPGGRIIYLGTPQTEETLYNTLQDRGYKARIWPAEMPSVDLLRFYGPRVAPFIKDLPLTAGEPVDPLRFDGLDLAERRASYGRSGYARQFLLDTSLSDANRFPLKLRDLIVTTVGLNKAPGEIVWCNNHRNVVEGLPTIGLTGDYFYKPLRESEESFEYSGSVLSIDPAGRGTDETGYVVTKFLNGVIYVSDFGGFKGGYEPSTLEALAKIARDHKVNLIQIEANFGDGMYTQLFRPVLQKYYNCTIEEVKHSKQKELRIIDTVEPVMNQHRLVVDYSALLRDYESTEKEPRYSLAYQMTRLTRDRGSLIHDDRIDALALGISYWVERVNADREKAYMKSKEEALDIELDKFMDNVFGGHSRPPVSQERGPKWVKV